MRAVAQLIRRPPTLSTARLARDAKNERVAGWYATYGAVPLLDTPLSLLLPLATIRAALKKAGKY
jgi:hypothetical protein